MIKHDGLHRDADGQIHDYLSSSGKVGKDAASNSYNKDHFYSSNGAFQRSSSSPLDDNKGGKNIASQIARTTKWKICRIGQTIILSNQILSITKPHDFDISI